MLSFCQTQIHVCYKLVFCARNMVKGYGVNNHIQQYFSYILTVSFISGGNQSTRRKPPTWHKSLAIFIRKARPDASH
jgi:hypothetical protein